MILQKLCWEIKNLGDSSTAWMTLSWLKCCLFLDFSIYRSMHAFRSYVVSQIPCFLQWWRWARHPYWWQSAAIRPIDWCTCCLSFQARSAPWLAFLASEPWAEILWRRSWSSSSDWCSHSDAVTSLYCTASSESFSVVSSSWIGPL